jgi:hypothetical protein
LSLEGNGITTLDHLVQVFPRKVFLDHVGLPVHLPEVVDGGDVGVLEAGGDLRFLEEALTHALLLQRAGLDGHGALQVRVQSLEDLAEPTLSDELNDLVLAEVGPWHADPSRSRTAPSSPEAGGRRNVAAVDAERTANAGVMPPQKNPNERGTPVDASTPPRYKLNERGTRSSRNAAAPFTVPMRPLQPAPHLQG